jgi:hypothetical protein
MFQLALFREGLVGFDISTNEASEPLRGRATVC